MVIRFVGSVPSTTSIPAPQVTYIFASFTTSVKAAFDLEISRDEGDAPNSLDSILLVLLGGG